jgi:beta-lactam-binding protein with PASTA domain
MKSTDALSRFVKILLYIVVFMITSGLGTYLGVHLMIRGQNSVIVPDLVGKEVVNALERLTDLGLGTKVKGSRYDPTVPKHHIIAQEPDPGTEIKPGRDVRLLISKGPQTVVYPNAVGLDLPLAAILLEENDLRQGHLSYTYHRERPREEILAQFPGPGGTGLRGAQVDFLVSAGPPPQWLLMADLKGMEFNTAIETMEKYHLTVGAMTRVDIPAVADNLVVDQSPAKGYPVLPGKSIDLTVNRRSRGPIGVRRQDATLFRYRVPEGFLRQHVRVRIIRTDGACEIFNDFARPGEEIWLMILRDTPTALFLYLEDELAITKTYD